MAVFNIARGEIFVGGVLKHPALKHVHAGDSETLIQQLEEADIVLDVRERF